MPQLKPTRLEAMLCNKRSHCNEKPVHHNKEQPLLATTKESLPIATKSKCSHKYIHTYIQKTLRGTTKSFSTVVASFYILASQVQGSNISTFSSQHLLILSILVIFCCCCFLNCSYLRCEVVSHCGFDVLFSNDYWCEVPFHELNIIYMQ